jgi:cAMP-dependent protein kinase regulator|mmetsp:Transcript_84106/g.132791  ORF Transcript_84106/g.132791 Transcript_84106/m.132791 type:complete len:439 (-) Transcript_84106:184-1500(-)
MGCGASAKKYEEPKQSGGSDPKQSGENKDQEPSAVKTEPEEASVGRPPPKKEKVEKPPEEPQQEKVEKPPEEKNISEYGALAGTASEVDLKACISGLSPAAVSKIKQAMEGSQKSVTVVAAPKEEEEEEDDDGENELTEAEFAAQEALFAKSAAARKSRAAVSADVEQRDASWQAPVHPKTTEQETRLEKALSTNFLFSCLTGDDRSSVIKAFYEHKVAAGETVIRQDDEVESGQPALYIFETGKLSVFKKDHNGKVFTYDTPGQYFGELALLYNAPRAATVIADEESVLWSIDRSTFNFLVKDAARQAAERRMDFLNQVNLLENLDADQKASLCDVMQVRIVAKDEYVFRQGDTSPLYLCILEDGQCVAEKDGDEVFSYKPKDYFGELALLKNDPRATSIRATETSKVLMIGADVFHRMVGQIEGKLREQALNYGSQ